MAKVLILGFGTQNAAGNVCQLNCIDVNCYLISTHNQSNCIVPSANLIIIITDLYSAFRSEDTEALDAAEED